MLSGFWNGGRGCSIETLAELIGDTPKVAFDQYGREWRQHYQDPFWAAIGAETRPEGASAAKDPSGAVNCLIKQPHCFNSESISATIPLCRH
jgi:hypothetical protein